MTALQPALPTAPPEPATNLLLITLDTVRADALNPYGQKRVTSPVIDRMAREGVLFEQAASSSPSTLPAHATLMTGRFPPDHGVRSNSGYVLAPENLTLAEILREHGYATAAEIAAPVLNADTALQQGFEHYRDLASPGIEKIRASAADGRGESFSAELEERGAADITRQGKAFLDRHRSRPFFLWLHYFDAHRLYVPHPELAAEIQDDPYLSEVLYVDTQIGLLLAHLEELGLRERTLVVLVADHGEGLGDHGETTHAYLVYDSTIHVPLIFWGPRDLPGGRRVPALVRTVDVAPTLLDWLDVPAPEGIQGRSLTALIRGEATDLGLPAYGESIELLTTFGGSTLRYLRMGDWKYIHQPEPALFDLSQDPGELRNLAAAQPERVRALRAELERIVSGMSGPADASVDIAPERAAQLEALGYAAGAVPASADVDSLELSGPLPRTLMSDLDALGVASGQAKLGLHARAVETLEPLVARHPDSPVILEAWAQSLDGMGRKDDARSALERVLAHTPCWVQPRHRLAVILAEQREWLTQLRVLREAFETCDPSYELLNEYAYALATNSNAELRDGAAAVAAAERAVSLAPNERAEIFDTLAAAYAEAGDFAKARRSAERAVALAQQQGLPPALVDLLRTSLERYRRSVPTRRS